MSHLFDIFHNKTKMLAKSIRFHQFTRKLIQIRAAETAAKYLAPNRYYKRPVLPKDIVIRVTERCFLNCKFCAQGGESGRVDRHNLDSGPVEPQTLRKIIDEASTWPIKPFIKITGGEPLVLGGKFIDVIHEMRQRKFVVKLNTNGMLLKNKRMARRIAETDLNYLSISIDGDKKTHNELRGNPKLFDAIMEGIDNVKGYCRELGKRNLMILVSMVVSSDNHDQVENVYRMAVNKKIDWVNFQFLNFTTPESCEAASQYAKKRFGTEKTPWTAFCNPRFNQIDPDLVQTQIEKLLAMRETVPISVMGGMGKKGQIETYYFSLDPIKNDICCIPFTGMHVIPPGKAVFCIDYPFYEYGDLREKSIKSVWYGEKATDFRRAMIDYYRQHNINFPQCQRCNWRFN